MKEKLLKDMEGNLDFLKAESEAERNMLAVLIKKLEKFVSDGTAEVNSIASQLVIFVQDFSRIFLWYFKYFIEVFKPIKWRKPEIIFKYPINKRPSVIILIFLLINNPLNINIPLNLLNAHYE